MSLADVVRILAERVNGRTWREDQPREPKGTAIGGQWTTAPGGARVRETATGLDPTTFAKTIATLGAMTVKRQQTARRKQLEDQLAEFERDGLMTPENVAALRAEIARVAPFSTRTANAVAKKAKRHRERYVADPAVVAAAGNPEAALAAAETEIRSLPYEKGYALDATGQILMAKTEFRPNEINFIGDELDRIRGAAVFTHNHPVGKSLSTSDILMATRLQIDEVRAVSPGVTYRMRFDYATLHPDDIGMLLDVYKVASKQRVALWDPLIQAGRMNLDEANLTHGHEVWTDILTGPPLIKGITYERIGYPSATVDAATAARRARRAERSLAEVPEPGPDPDRDPLVPWMPEDPDAPPVITIDKDLEDDLYPVSPASPASPGSVLQDITRILISGNHFHLYDPDQPRDPEGTSTGGQWTFGKGTTPSSAAAQKAPVTAQTVDEAYDALTAGQKVVLAKTSMVSTLLDKLAAKAQEARDSGGKIAINLCDVSVDGTNIFCSEHKGISRVDMPQLSGVPAKGSPADLLPKSASGEVDLAAPFIAHLESMGITVASETVQSSHLKATQNELDGAKVSAMMKAMESGKLPPGSLFASKDDYVVDGHHRWAAKVGVDARSSTDLDAPMPIKRVNADVLTILVHANKFTRAQGIAGANMAGKAEKPKKLSDAFALYDPDQPRDPKGTAEGGQWTFGKGTTPSEGPPTFGPTPSEGPAPPGMPPLPDTPGGTPPGMPPLPGLTGDAPPGMPPLPVGTSVPDDAPPLHPSLEGTKVLDTAGNPLKMFHGSGVGFASFDVSKVDPESLYGPGLYFTDNPAIASSYSAKVSEDIHQKRDSMTGAITWVDKEIAKATAAGDTRKVKELTKDRADYQAVLDSAGGAPNVRPAYLRVTKPLDMDATITSAQAAKIVAISGTQGGGTRLAPAIAALYAREAPVTGENLYDTLVSTVTDKAKITAVLQEAGYDGITHVGGRIRGDGTLLHRVWITFATEQARSAFDPETHLSEVALAGYDPNQPRGRGDQGGQWIKVGAGVDTVDLVGPVDIGTVARTADEAYALLSAGQKVILAKPSMVSTLLDKLAEKAREARATGGEIRINLCDVSVEGTNIFCGEHKGFARLDMPQLRGIPRPGSPADQLAKNPKGMVDLSGAFLAHLAAQGIPVTDGVILASHLKASQRELDGALVAEKMQALEAGVISTAGISHQPRSAIFVAQDDYIVDGHHNWAAKLGADLRSDQDLDAPLPIHRIHTDILSVLLLANQFTRAQGVTGKALSEVALAGFDPTQPRGRGDQGGQWIKTGATLVSQTVYRGQRMGALLGPDDHMVVAKVGDLDAGFLWATQTPTGFTVRRVEVAPEFQRQGIATQLYQAASALGPHEGASARTPEGDALVAALKTRDPKIFALPLEQLAEHHLAGFDPDQPRDPGGAEGGQWISAAAAFEAAREPEHVIQDDRYGDLTVYHARLADPTVDGDGVIPKDLTLTIGKDALATMATHGITRDQLLAAYARFPLALADGQYLMQVKATTVLTGQGGPTPTGGGLIVKVKDAADPERLTLARSIGLDDHQARHQYFFVQPSLQGTGIGTVQAINTDLFYRAIGVTTITLDAASLTIEDKITGHQVWPKQGFTWADPEEADMIRAAFTEKMRTDYPIGSDEYTRATLLEARDAPAWDYVDFTDGKMRKVGFLAMNLQTLDSGLRTAVMARQISGTTGPKSGWTVPPGDVTGSQAQWARYKDKAKAKARHRARYAPDLLAAAEPPPGMVEALDPFALIASLLDLTPDQLHALLATVDPGDPGDPDHQLMTLEQFALYDPQQPRAPEGSTIGGQWIATGVLPMAATPRLPRKPVMPKKYNPDGTLNGALDDDEWRAWEKEATTWSLLVAERDPEWRPSWVEIDEDGVAYLNRIPNPREVDDWDTVIRSGRRADKAQAIRRKLEQGIASAGDREDLTPGERERLARVMANQPYTVSGSGSLTSRGVGGPWVDAQDRRPRFPATLTDLPDEPFDREENIHQALASLPAAHHDLVRRTKALASIVISGDPVPFQDVMKANGLTGTAGGYYDLRSSPGKIVLFADDDNFFRAPATAVHEFGHAVHAAFALDDAVTRGYGPLDKDPATGFWVKIAPGADDIPVHVPGTPGRPIYARTLTTVPGSGVTQYGKTNNQEAFAEAYTMYAYPTGRAYMRAAHPEAFTYMEAIYQGQPMTEADDLVKRKDGSYAILRGGKSIALAAPGLMALEQFALAGFDPNQPRDPGGPEGGQWIKAGAGAHAALAGTKAVGPDGQPVRVYHGTATAFDQFDPAKLDPQALFGPGYYFTEDAGIASEYSGKDMPPTTSGNPLSSVTLTVDAKIAELEKDIADYEKATAALISMGPDRVKAYQELLTYARADLAKLMATAPNVKPAFMRITQPFDLDAPMPVDRVDDILAAVLTDTRFVDSDRSAAVAEINARVADAMDREDLIDRGERDGIAAYANLERRPFTGEMFYESLTRHLGAKGGIRDLLKDAGYDGLTHVGGGRTGDRPHRVWIAFSAEQVRSAFDPSAQLAESVHAPFTRNPEFVNLADHLLPVEQYALAGFDPNQPRGRGDQGGQWVKVGSGLHPALEGTKALGPDGQPLRLYHGSSAVFDKFDPAKLDPQALFGPGLYFTDDASIAAGYTTKAPSGAREDLEQVAARIRAYEEVIADLTTENAKYRRARAKATTQATKDKLTDAIYENEGRIRGYQADMDAEPFLAPNIKPAFMRITEPYDMDAALPRERATALLGTLRESDLFVDSAIAGAESTVGGFYAAADAATGERVYEALVDHLGSDADARVAIRDAMTATGYDGITHVGGGRTGREPHRVYIAFTPEQVRAAYDPSHHLAEPAHPPSTRNPAFVNRALIEQTWATRDLPALTRYPVSLRETVQLAEAMVRTPEGRVILDDWAPGAAGILDGLQFVSRVSRGDCPPMAQLTPIQNIPESLPESLTSIASAAGYASPAAAGLVQAVTTAGTERVDYGQAALDLGDGTVLAVHVAPTDLAAPPPGDLVASIVPQIHQHCLAEPSVQIPLVAQGTFVEIAAPSPPVLAALRAAGYDGVFTRGDALGTPGQLTLWNPTALVRFGAWAWTREPVEVW